MKKLSILFALAMGTLSASAAARTYCNYYGDELSQLDGKYCAITVETADNGDVVLTISDGPGYTNCTYRSGGWERGIAAFWVNEEAAENYFEYVKPADGTTEARLRLLPEKTVPAGATITYKEKALSWKCDQDNNRYHQEALLEYAYGSANCDHLAVPANVAVNTDSILSFDAVDGADHYQVRVTLDGVLKLQQAIASGDKIPYTPMVSGTYQVQVRACGYDILDSEWSAAVDWELTAQEVVLGASEYCHTLFKEGTNQAAYFTWETLGTGSVVISIENGTAEAEDAEHYCAFRGDGITLDKFKVSGQPASNYFKHSISGDKKQITLTLTDENVAPVLGEKITVDAVIEYRTPLDGNAWPTLQFTYTYGTHCEGTSTMVDATQMETAHRAVKVLENGQVFIMLDGVRYTVLGVEAR